MACTTFTDAVKQFGKRHLVADFSNLTWQHPLVANYGKFAREEPLVVDLSIALWWLIYLTQEHPGWPIIET